MDITNAETGQVQEKVGGGKLSLREIISKVDLIGAGFPGSSKKFRDTQKSLSTVDHIISNPSWISYVL